MWLGICVVLLFQKGHLEVLLFPIASQLIPSHEWQLTWSKMKQSTIENWYDDRDTHENVSVIKKQACHARNLLQLTSCGMHTASTDQRCHGWDYQEVPPNIMKKSNPLWKLYHTSAFYCALHRDFAAKERAEQKAKDEHRAGKACKKMCGTTTKNGKCFFVYSSVCPLPVPGTYLNFIVACKEFPDLDDASLYLDRMRRPSTQRGRRRMSHV